MMNGPVKTSISIMEQKTVTKLLEGTRKLRIDWQATATGEIIAAVGGKYAITLSDETENFNSVMKIRNAQGDALVILDSVIEPRLPVLYELAKQAITKCIDDQLADLIKEIEAES